MSVWDSISQVSTSIGWRVAILRLLLSLLLSLLYLSNPMFHTNGGWNWTQVSPRIRFSFRPLWRQIFWNDTISAGIVRQFQDFMIHSEIWWLNCETVSWQPKPWVSQSNRESWVSELDNTQLKKQICKCFTWWGMIHILILKESV